MRRVGHHDFLITWTVRQRASTISHDVNVAGAEAGRADPFKHDRLTGAGDKQRATTGRNGLRKDGSGIAAERMAQPYSVPRLSRPATRSFPKLPALKPKAQAS
jgi:hypothetical protein